jgi:GMP synthase (glutamine-hydrolysing)
VSGRAVSGAKVREERTRPNSERGGVVVLDFGGQYTQLIARRIREQQVFSSVLPCTASVQEIQKLEPAGIVFSGGPSSVYDAESPKCDVALLELGLPVLGICYGMHWITHALGGKVLRAERREYGSALLNLAESQAESELFAGIPNALRIWNSHGDHVVGLPPGFRATAHTENAIGATENPERKIYTVEFHPEVRHTDKGTEILRNFLFRVCKAEPKWSGAAFIEE